jgi:hypothetical protein
MKLLIKNATVFYGGWYKREDILISGGKIQEIRERICAGKGMEVLEGKDYLILPGFISTVESETQQVVLQGVTTAVKNVVANIEEDNILMSESGLLDYVYRVHLQRWTKKYMEMLGYRRIKLITPVTNIVDWDPWIAQLQRLGMAIDFKNKDFREAIQLPLSVVVAYPLSKRPPRSRIVVRVDETVASQWLRGWRGLAPFNPASYWLDSLTVNGPGITSVHELKDFLLFMSHVRSRVPAKLLGIFPRKGCIHVGADADLLFFQEKSLLGYTGLLQPTKVMLDGQFIDDVAATTLPMRKGTYLPGNQTYAFQY